jgi:hypothetical protein
MKHMTSRNIQNEQTPLTLWECKQEAARLFNLYLDEFSEAPEAKRVVHKQFFSPYPDGKLALQNDTIQIPRRDFIWYFKYSMIGEEKILENDRMIGLKNHSTSIVKSAREDREMVEITRRRFYLVDEPGGTIHYTLLHMDGSTVHHVNTVEAVTLTERLLAAFRADLDR